ncbi:DUF1080 domain-containing protein [uncultured Draconibacterium sp.]|uniref:DUF1080 domain-containing protein n=1 Tax=uncultured Draconibacterium sp. TaxID=1573823 RepID=UPI0029C8CBBC|nr:DUF1080 domain-containing protein [uncultured Draconibacterium sp.]
MKKYRIQITTILLLACFSLAGFAQDKRTLDTKVADVLAQMPTKNLTHRDKAMNEIFLMGDEGYQKLAAQLVPLGTGDDTAVRFAMNSFSRYASQFGKNEERAFAEVNLLKALNTANDVEVKTFLLNQLNLVAGEKTVEQVKSYLTDEQLAEPATQTILSTEDPKTAEVFLAAFPKVEGETQMTIVRALGRLKCKRAVLLITPLVSADIESMQKTALATLANIGSADSYNTLLNAASDVNFNYDATNAAEAFLTYTKRLGEQNEMELMEKACKAIFKANSANDHLHNYSAALRIYAENLGYEATPLLLEVLDSPNKAFRYSALNIAENLGGVADTRKWITKAEAADPEVKAEIIDMLGRRGCEQANDFVLASLKSSAEVVRTEAITALAKLQGIEATSALIAHLAQGKDIEATTEVLGTLLDKDHLYLIAGNLNESTGKTKAAFIDLIGAKAGSQYFDEILTAASSADADEKAAAFAALKQVSSYENTNALLKLLLSLSDPSEITETQLALMAVVDGIAEEQDSNGKVLSTLEQSNKKARLFPILPTIGGETALETVTRYFNSSSGEQRQAAFTALTNWQDYAASKPLYEICQSDNATFSQPAFNSFVRMVASANLPDDQKLLQYRKVMNYAADDQKNVIAAIGRLRTFLSLVYLEQYLEEEALTATTSRAIMNIAMPDSNGEDGLTGDIVRRILGKAEQALSGEDSAYDKINIRNYLNDMPKDKGYVSLFNGKNLDGWQGMLLDGNPIKIAKLSETERAKEQEAANIKMRENWSVKDGMIIFNGKGANLVSKKIYKDFDMIVDWRISKKGDSGIYLRGAPQVQVWDTSRVEVGAQVGSGGLYNNNPDNVRDPLLVADNPIDEWNTFRITMVGENVTVYLNGELVVDNVKMDNYWDRSIPIFSEGTIELQAHGNELAFRDVYVREINTDEIGLTQEEIDEGFVSLFNGKNLDGWQGNLTDYYAENGELVVNPKAGGHGNLYTENEYSDFVFRFEFKLTPGANNGLGIRTPLEGDAAYVGMELQILDNTAPIYANLHEYQYHGSVYGTIPAKRGFLNPVGDWNTQEVVVKGTKIKITLNGEVILDGDISDARKNGTPDGKDHPGLQRDKGYIGFLGHGSELWFRNIRIKDLSE